MPIIVGLFLNRELIYPTGKRGPERLNVLNGLLEKLELASPECLALNIQLEGGIVVEVGSSLRDSNISGPSD